jgi:hypothetical protein
MDRSKRVSSTTIGVMRSDADDLPAIAQRELGRLARADQSWPVGEVRVRAQNHLIGAGLARLLYVDGRPVCRITRRGRTAEKVRTDGQVTLLQQKLRGLRSHRTAELLRIDCAIEAAKTELDAIHRAAGRQLPIRRPRGRPYRTDIDEGALRAALRRSGGIIRQAARELGIPRGTVARHARRLSIVLRRKADPSP